MNRQAAVVVGTRPEAIKLAGIVRLLGDDAWVIHTGQHYDISLRERVLAAIGFPEPETTLDIGGLRRGSQIGRATAALDELFAERRPDVVVVQGDTNSALAGGLAANSAEIPLVHVEAGLRSRDRSMPEETNRVLLDHIADACCAPTTQNVENLDAEGIEPEMVHLTGNPIVEAVTQLIPTPQERQALLAQYGVRPDGFVVATLHRPENVDHAETLAAALETLGALPLPVVLPLHPRTAANVAGFGLGRALDALQVVEPLSPIDFLGLAAEATLLVSDSGGIAEEASILKRPLVVVRRSTERPEVMGTFADLVRPGPGLAEAIAAWLDDGERRAALAELPCPFGDGQASARIVALTRDRWLAEV
jgi:UDP-N-acetylglucosamine 2-epimerase (non-hydrolysing)